MVFFYLGKLLPFAQIVGIVYTIKIEVMCDITKYSGIKRKNTTKYREK